MCFTGEGSVLNSMSIRSATESYSMNLSHLTFIPKVLWLVKSLFAVFLIIVFYRGRLLVARPTKITKKTGLGPISLSFCVSL